MFLFCLAAAAWAQPRCDQALASAQAALQQGAVPTAVSLLQAQEAHCAGDSRFDQLLGFSLLANGQAEQASWVLSRAVASNPRNGAAWLDLAVAALRIGERQQAQEALQHAQQLQPPPAAQQKIQQLQSALQHLDRAWALSGYLNQEIGWDSNVNSATDQSSIIAPGFSRLPIKLDAASQRAASSYADLEIGGTLSWQLDADWTLYLLPRAKQRHYLELHQFDRSILGLQAGASRRVGDALLIGMLQGEGQKLGGSDYLHSGGGTLEWRQPLWRRSLLTLTGQFTKTRYDDKGMRNYDNDTLLGGVSWKQMLTPQLSWTLAGYRGEDDGVNNRAGGSRRMVILSSALSYHCWSRIDSTLSLTHEADNYSKMDPAFLRTRSESLWNYSASLTWQLNKTFSAGTSYSYIRDDANIPLYASQRHIVAFNLRGDF